MARREELRRRLAVIDTLAKQLSAEISEFGQAAAAPEPVGFGRDAGHLLVIAAGSAVEAVELLQDNELHDLGSELDETEREEWVEPERLGVVA